MRCPNNIYHQMVLLCPSNFMKMTFSVYTTFSTPFLCDEISQIEAEACKEQVIMDSLRCFNASRLMSQYLWMTKGVCVVSKFVMITIAYIQPSQNSFLISMNGICRCYMLFARKDAGKDLLFDSSKFHWFLNLIGHVLDREKKTSDIQHYKYQYVLWSQGRENHQATGCSDETRLLVNFLWYYALLLQGICITFEATRGYLLLQSTLETPIVQLLSSYYEKKETFRDPHISIAIQPQPYQYKLQTLLNEVEYLLFGNPYVYHTTFHHFFNAKQKSGDEEIRVIR